MFAGFGGILAVRAGAGTFTRSPAAGGLRTIGADERRVPGQAVGSHPVVARAVAVKVGMPG